MIGWIGFAQMGEATRGVPVEFTGIHNDTADGGAVAANKFGGRMYYHSGAKINGAQQAWGGYGIIHHQGDTVLGTQGSDAFQIDNVEFGIADALYIKGFGSIIILRFLFCKNFFYDNN